MHLWRYHSALFDARQNLSVSPAYVFLKAGPGVDAGDVSNLSRTPFGFAADLPREGRYDYTTCFARTVTHIEYSPTQSAWSYNERGSAISNPQGGMFDGDEIQCVGTTASLDGKRYGGSACIAVAKDGAKRLTRFWYDADGKFQRETVGGTGRYDGMVTTGTVQTVKESEGIKPGTQTVEYCNRNVDKLK